MAGYVNKKTSRCPMRGYSMAGHSVLGYAWSSYWRLQCARPSIQLEVTLPDALGAWIYASCTSTTLCHVKHRGRRAEGQRGQAYVLFECPLRSTLGSAAHRK